MLTLPMVVDTVKKDAALEVVAVEEELDLENALVIKNMVSP